MKIRTMQLLIGGGMMMLSLGACDPCATRDARGATSEAGSESPKKEAESLDPILVAPKVGDLYAVELTAFSGADFKDHDDDPSDPGKAYGLMKVISVLPDRVTVNTEMSAWPNPRGARNDLNGDLADIRWDESEKIPIKRADFAKLVREEKIIEVRRLDGNS